VQFNISFDVADSPDLGSLTSSEQQAILDTANAAATIWSWYLTPANVTLDLAITVDNSLFSGSTLAEGGPANFVRTGTDFSGKHVYESNTAAELRTGLDRNGSAADLDVGLTVNSIRNMLMFKTDDYATVTGGRADALSVFLHEIGHGLGFMYLTDPSFSGVGIFDTFVQAEMFIGANAEQASGLLSGVPLEPGSESHLAESGVTKSDLMSPALSSGTNTHISATDLGILQDIGVPIHLASSGADVMHAVTGVALHLGAGNDTGYALAGGSTIYGEDGDDQLYGGKRNDFLYGGNGNDYLEGGTGNDVIDGGSGQDKAGFSGNYASYVIVDNGAGNLTVTGPDGVDTLTGVEQLAFSDRVYNVSGGSTSGSTRSDFDGDRMSDILWQNDSGQAGIWFMNAANISSGPLVGPNPGTSWHVKSSGDFDGNGKADILWQNDSGQAAIWLMNGATVLSGPAVGPNPGPSWHVKGAGDFDGDGKSDILWQNDNGQVGIWLMNGTAVLSGPAVGNNSDPSWHVIGGGDFDGDGKSDMLWQNDNGQAGLWMMNGTTITSGPVVGGNPGPSWHVKGSGDFDGDGKSDILWQNDNGQVGIWLMNGSTVLSSPAVGNNSDPNWHVAGAGDINGDGKADILWQNSNGQAGAWLMSGTTVLSGPTLGSNPGPAWHMIASTGS